MDSDYDGVGDNSDFDPFDASETKDTDGDGVGDNEDLWPLDSSKKRDSDGDGIADSEDAFPNNARMSTWVGPFVSLMIFGAIIAFGIIYLKKIKKVNTVDEEWPTERPSEAPLFADWK